MTDLACTPPALLLDAGCGTGLWSVALARAGYRVRGVDISPQMIAEAQQLTEKHGVAPETIDFEVGSTDHIDAPDAAFDGIIWRNVLDSVPAPAATLGEFWRVLKSGHRLVLSVLGARSPVKRDEWRRFLPEAPALLPVNYMLQWEVEALLAELGWQIVDGRPHFGPAASGVVNEYTPERAERFGDRTVLQAIATAWEVVAVKPADAGVSDG